MSRRQPFDWLRDGYCRRSALREVAKAVQAGWLDGPDPAIVARRQALLAALCDLAEAPLRSREFLTLSRTVLALQRRDLDRQIPDLPDLDRESTA